jgi:F-type H+-transporting ATPase subunit delta
MLDRIFGSRVSPTLMNFLKVVARRRRLGMLRSIEKSVGVMRDAATGRLQILLTTAEPLDVTSMETIRTSLSMKFNAPVSVSNKVDPSILGGLVIRVGDVVYDGSVDCQLKNLRNTTVAKAEQAIRDRLGSLAS